MQELNAEYLSKFRDALDEVPNKQKKISEAFDLAMEEAKKLGQPLLIDNCKKAQETAEEENKMFSQLLELGNNCYEIGYETAKATHLI